MTNERTHHNSHGRNKGQQQRLTSGSNAPAARQPFHNPAMADSLQALMRQSFAETPPENLAPHAGTRLGPIPSADKDGITYINFSRSARTELGHVLSFDNMLGFDHPVLGLKVPTIQHYWAFVQNGATNARVFSYTTDRLRSFIRQLGKPTYVRHQYALLAQAYWNKFKAYPTLADIFVNCDADLDYVIDSDAGRRRPMSAAYLVDILKQCRAALRSGRELDLVRFMDQDVQLELKSLSRADCAQRVTEILDGIHQAARERDEQFQAEKKARQAKPQPNQGKNKQRQNKADKAAPVEQASMASVAVAPFVARISDQDQAAVDPAKTEPVDVNAFTFPGNVEAAAAPAAPAAPSAPAAPAASANPEAAPSPAAPAAPSASAEEGEQTAVPADEDGDAVVLNGFTAPVSAAVAA